jgi:hypothetical protein
MIDIDLSKVVLRYVAFRDIPCDRVLLPKQNE